MHYYLLPKAQNIRGDGEEGSLINSGEGVSRFKSPNINPRFLGKHPSELSPA